MVNKKRIAAKAMTWRVASVLITFVLAKLFGFPMVDASAFTILHAVISTFAYMLHEVAWNRRKK